MLGLNGAGKSTLIKIMAGVDQDYEGEARPQPGIKIGYLPQEPVLDPEKSVKEVIEESFAEVNAALKRLDEVYAEYADENADFDALAKEQAKLEAIIQAHDGHNIEVQIDKAADALRLPPADRKIKVLSGGERRRVALCRLLLEKPDMLLLDEPTNDLDVDTLRSLEEGIMNYPGCVLVTSHDRWFLDRLATHILAYEDDGHVEWFDGNFEDYENKSTESENIEKENLYTKIELL